MRQSLPTLVLAGEFRLVVDAAGEEANTLDERIDTFAAVERRLRDHRGVRNRQGIVSFAELDVQLAERRTGER